MISHQRGSCPESMKVNILAIAAGLLGVVCILLPWSVMVTDSVFGDSTVERTMTDYIHHDDPAFALAIVLFLMGSATALITPLGSVGQFFGWLVFLAAISADLKTTETSIATVTTSLGTGFFVGVVATALVIASILYPMGFGYSRRALGGRDRLLTWSS